MGFFDSIMNLFNPGSEAPIMLQQTSGPVAAPASASAPALPALPTILQTTPTPQQPAVMPTLSSGLAAARAQVQQMMANRQGRASTILTTRKRRRSTSTGATSFDTFSAPHP